MGEYQIIQRHSPTRYLIGCVNIVYCKHWFKSFQIGFVYHVAAIKFYSKNQSTLPGTFTTGKMVTKGGKNIYSWINWICCTRKTFSFVEDKLNREYTNFEPISVNTLKKYMKLLTKRIESKVVTNLPEKFAFAIGG